MTDVTMARVVTFWLVCLDFNPILRYLGVKCTREHVTHYQEDVEWLGHSDKIKSLEIKLLKEENGRQLMKKSIRLFAKFLF